jgi:hypothetical protein
VSSWLVGVRDWFSVSRPTVALAAGARCEFTEQPEKKAKTRDKAAMHRTAVLVLMQIILVRRDVGRQSRPAKKQH